MPVYRYKCRCGRANDVFSTENKSSKICQCDNCGRGVSARQVVDKSAIFKEKDGTIGILRRNA